MHVVTDAAWCGDRRRVAREYAFWSSQLSETTRYDVHSHGVKGISVPSTEGMVMTLGTSLPLPLKPQNSADVYQQLGCNHVYMAIEPTSVSRNGRSWPRVSRRGLDSSSSPVAPWRWRSASLPLVNFILQLGLSCFVCFCCQLPFKLRYSSGHELKAS
jgi:hypothetical protein